MVFLEGIVNKCLGMVLLMLGASSFAFAVAAPEIDPGSAGSAFAMVAGALLIVRARLKR